MASGTRDQNPPIRLFDGQIRSAFCQKRGSSHTNRFQRFGVNRTPLLETGLPLSLAPRGSHLGVCRRHLPVGRPHLEQLLVLLLRHELEQVDQVLVLQTHEPLSRTLKQCVLGIDSVIHNTAQNPLRKDSPVLGIAGCN